MVQLDPDFEARYRALAPTPPMGWNSWNRFGGAINETVLRETAEAMVSSGMQAVGYQYVVIDDLWQGERDAQGNLHEDPQKFPSGIKALADYVHSLGLKLGIYSDAAEKTCGNAVGSYGYEERDAETFASWGCDFLKYDYCHAPPEREAAVERYTKMGQALIATGRPIIFSICEWGGRQPWEWGAQAFGHMWRTTGDIGDFWSGTPPSFYLSSIENIGFEYNRKVADYAGPGRWNDPDMLVVGLHGVSNMGGQGCTDTEYRTHFGLWCMQAAPLMAGCDLRTMDETTREIMTNPEVIALDQDPLGKQGIRVTADEGREVWKKPLQNNELGVGLFNRGEQTAVVTAQWSDLGIEGPYTVRDLWARKDLGQYTNSFSAEVPSHGSVLLRLTR